MNDSDAPPPLARYVMIGGFLGAGKTTAVDKLARYLTDRGERVGLITNDQSHGLVDTTLLRQRGFDVEEITGGCFCCRFDSLHAASEKLSAATRPDTFIAEPVGSCTDLLATVSYPLRRIYGESFRIAPLSVLVDPRRAARVLGLEDGRSFSEKVVYVYRKQLEEADVIVVNKCDALDAGLRARLVAALDEQFPQATVFCASAKDGAGLEPWFEHVLAHEGTTRPTMELCYDTYADGEAQLGWLNATFTATAPTPFDGNALVVRLADQLQGAIRAGGGEIAHLKMTLESDDAAGQLSVVSVVDSEEEPDLRESVLDAVGGGTLIVNLRAEMAPETLSAHVAEAVAAENRLGCAALSLTHEERFRPARPTPTHRLSVTEAD